MVYFPEGETNPAKDVMLRCLIGTGSTCNTISCDEYCILYENSPPRLKESKVCLRTYDGSVIKPVGQDRIDCELKYVTEVLKFEAVNENLATLLGSDTWASQKFFQGDKVDILHLLFQVVLPKDIVML